MVYNDSVEISKICSKINTDEYQGKRECVAHRKVTKARSSLRAGSIAVWCCGSTGINIRFTMRTQFQTCLLFVIILAVCVVIFISQDKKAPRRELAPRKWPYKDTLEEMQAVDDANSTYVFSAYLDTIQTETQIHVIGITTWDVNGCLKPDLVCSLWYRIGNSYYVEKVTADVTYNPGHSGFRYAGVDITCPVYSKRNIPNHVSIVPKSGQGPPNRLVILTNAAEPEVNFTVCLPPLQNKYDNVQQLIEAVAVNLVFGANKFVFYNLSISARISSVLEVLVGNGLADVVQWPLPAHIQPLVHYFAQLAAMNDCLYRNRYRTRYIVNTDLDEFIVPRKTDRWLTMMEPILKTTPSTAAFSVRCYMFCSDYKNSFHDLSQKEKAIKYNSKTLLNTNRTSLAIPPHFRTKYIFDPKRVITYGVHYVWAFVPGFSGAFVSPDDVSVNHYRDTPVSNERPGIVDTYSVDTRMYAFQDSIVTGLTEQWEHMESYLGSLVL